MWCPRMDTASIGKRVRMADEFQNLTLDDVAERAEAAGPERMPGTGREVPNAWRQLREEMLAEGAERVGDLRRERVDHHRFTTKEHYAKVTPKLLGAGLDKPKLTGADAERAKLTSAGEGEAKLFSTRTEGPRLLSAIPAADEEKPPPPRSWAGRFLAIYPDGSTSDYDLTGHELRPGEALPSGHILDRFEVSDKPVEPGKWMVVGILREPDA